MIAGEQVRLKLHDGKLIKERRYHLRTYPNCLVGQEVIDWLVSHKEAPDRITAVCLMQHLMDQEIVHHGCELIDWIIQNGEAESRHCGLDLCRALYEHGIIQHVSKKHIFFDSGLLYQFCINFRRRRRLSELISDTEQNNEEVGMVSLEENSSPFVASKNPLHDEPSGFQSVGLRKEIKSLTSGRRGSFNSRADFPSFTPRASISMVLYNPKSVLSRNITCGELLAPGAPFIKRVLTVIGDALGWGFVVRGTAPVYVQAVDPGSPAAAAGIKVRQFVYQVNGQFVLYMDYRTVTRLVMTGTLFSTYSGSPGSGAQENIQNTHRSLMLTSLADTSFVRPESTKSEKLHNKETCINYRFVKRLLRISRIFVLMSSMYKALYVWIFVHGTPLIPKPRYTEEQEDSFMSPIEEQEDSCGSTPTEEQEDTRESTPTEEQGDTRESTPTEEQEDTRESTPTEEQEDTRESTPTEEQEDTRESTPTEEQEDTRESTPTEEQEDTRESTPTEEQEDTRGSTPTEEQEDTRGSTPTEEQEDTRGSTPTEEQEDTRGSTPTEEQEDTRESTPTEEQEDTRESTPTEEQEDTRGSTPTEEQEDTRGSTPTEEQEDTRGSTPTEEQEDTRGSSDETTGQTMFA
uniref:Uncharacterized protein n=1 Tax=Knipowitschia caucasica TaxID=637954 RepID=A0AAV2M5M8_KNICA